jgi:sugar lactone lactonase YvrE
MVAMRHLFISAVLAASCCAPGALAFGEAPKYLIVSSPATNKVVYMQLPKSGAPADGGTFKLLVRDGLTYPQGIAVDEYRKMLYVADPSLGKLVRYPLVHKGASLAVGPMELVASNVETRAVAVDGIGNVWFTDESTHRLLRVTAKSLQSGNTTPEVVNEGPKVVAPGGVAVDNFFVYWLNKAGGIASGTLNRGPQEAHTNNSQVTLANNAEKFYGVCLAMNNIFYTDDANFLYGVHRASTDTQDVTTITSTFKEPRGCAFDGDNTVYVADKGDNAVYQFASNMNPLLADRPMTKAADLQGAFGLAVYVRVM